MQATIRSAHTADIPDILRLMRGLAVFQGIEDRYEPRGEYLRIQMGSTGNPRIHCHIAHVEGTAVGYALYYLRDYASFRSKWKALHLEDLFVEEAFRGAGIGRQLLQQVAKYASDFNVDYLSLDVHQDNTVAKEGYAKLGAITPPPTFWEPLMFPAAAIKRLIQ